MASSSCTRLSAAALFVLVSASGAGAQTTLPPDESKTLGRRVADAAFLDENGSTLEVGSLAGRPLVVSPIFTKCRHTCPMITTSLRGAVEGAGVPGEDFNVLSLSFDTSDTGEDLRTYREAMRLPEAWKLARARSEELLPFLESLDFHFISNADGTFAHPNLVVVLTPELRVAKYLYGVAYEAEDLRAALEIARGAGSLLESLGPYIFVIGVLGAIVSAFIILVTVSRSRRHAGKPA